MILQVITKSRLLLWGSIALLLMVAKVAAAADTNRELALPRLSGALSLDGELSDPIWTNSLRIKDFYETSPGDNTPPVVQTISYLGYDSRFFYVAMHNFDPRPEEIRASFTDRDSVWSDQDFVQFDLDTRNDEESSFVFRVNPKGIPADALFSEATGLDDFSPDFSFEVQARITEDGWIAEFRIPLSSLRYPDVPVQTWGITLYRNYPREFRRQMTSLPIPRGANCWLCYNIKLTGLTDLPPARYLLLVPFATSQNESTGGPSKASSLKWDGGVDLKWIPRNNVTLDATLNPDFAQIEADMPQITANNRFALFYPEKRSFFLEGADLLSTPLNVVHTRTITSPAWGARATGRAAGASYTFLVAEDEGGGGRIVPGPLFSRLVPQLGHSRAAIGRMRYTLGSSYTGFVFTDRASDSGANRVLGPDLQWRPSPTNQITAQWLLSKTESAGREPVTDSALSLGWLHSEPDKYFQLDYQRLGHEFRADNGFVPQVGIERRAASLGYRFYPSGFLRQVQPGFTWDSSVEIGDEPVSRATYPSLSLGGKWNTQATFEYHFRERVRTATKLLEYSFLAYDVRIQPTRFLAAAGIHGNAGQQVDVVHERVGAGGTLGFDATLRIGPHLNTELGGERQWLNLRRARLFTADVARVRTTCNFDSRTFVRVIGQYERIHRDTSLYGPEVDADEGTVNWSLLFGYRFNWQSVVYAGFSGGRVLMGGAGYRKSSSQFFVKIAYAVEPRLR
jgi:hypothetical protein